MSILEKDVEICFPHVTILKASAGSGKTYSLAERFIQFLLSGKIPQNHLRNILAITFSNNAAQEMKKRILSGLKDIYFKDPQKIEEFSEIVSLKKEYLADKAGAMIDIILKNYTEFQVKTIDSFMTSIYKASAIHLGYSPDFEMIMEPETIMTYAFHRFLRGVNEGTAEGKFLERLLEIILERKGGDSAYLWDPSKDILEETMELYYKLSGMVKEVKIVDALEEIEIVKKKIRERVESLHGLIQKSGLPLREGSSFFNILEIVRGNRFPDLIPRGLLNVPVIKPEAVGKRTEYQKITEQWDLLGSAIKEYIELYAKTYYGPYLRAYEDLKNSLEEVKRREGLLFIHDINKGLSDYLNHEMIPDVYFRIGETIYHYLIDEFQDTSPIQWANLFPLIENSLSQGGSLFVVGDTKQAIYGFRNADYRIMRGLESENPFSSALHQVKELETNYRSLEEVVNFSKVFFKEVMANHDTYREPARRSGLLDYEQKVRQGHRGSGYVEIIRCEKNEDRPAEKEKIQELIKELIQRGYSRSDIAILAYRNEDVVNITTWLNEIGILFISYSSLDIRTRKLTAEIVALLTFLDSPPDDLSFAGFLLGDIFREVLERDNKAIQWKGLHDFFLRNRRKSPLYKAFQKEFPEIWEDYFGALFKSTGYLPLYDLVSQIYRIFAVFDHFEEEEATLVKILEVIKNFEGEGRNNPSDFLKRASDEETEEANWTLDVPAGIDAVRVMTLHKAKGLESPVTLVLLYEEHPRGFKYILDEEREGGALLKITQAIMKGSPFLQKRYEEERIKDLVNKINTLYVGFSRAQDELYIIGVEGKGNRLPLDLLQIMDSHSLGSKFGSKRTPRFHPPEMGQEVLKPYHHPDPIQFPFAPVAELNLDERLRGEFIHRVLYFVEELHEDIETELEGILHRVNEELKTDYPVGDMKAKLLEFLKHETIKPYFQARPGRVIKKEQGFSDSKGNLFRMDRVIFEADRVWVIDYKTGTDQEAEKEYVSQLKNYIRILNEIYSERNVEGVLAYVDLKEVKKVIRS